MKPVWTTLAIVICCAALLKAEDKTPATATPSARNVRIAMDSTPFTIGENDIVRLLAKGIAGTKFAISVTGPGKVVATNHLSLVRRGHNLIGALMCEYEIQPTGKGKVTAKVTTTPPQGDTPESAVVYEFEVK